MQDERHQPELSQSSYPDMGLEGDAEVGLSWVKYFETEGFKSHGYSTGSPINVFGFQPDFGNVDVSIFGIDGFATTSVPEENVNTSIDGTSGYPAFDYPTVPSFFNEHSPGHSISGAPISFGFDANSLIAPTGANVNFDSSSTATIWNDFNDFNSMNMRSSNSMNYPSIGPSFASSYGQPLQNPISLGSAHQDWNNSNNQLVATAVSSVASLATSGPSVLPQAPALHRCNWPGCNKGFRRHSDLRRHRDAVHFKIQGHLCPVPGCPRARGNGHSRADKLTEHLWRKHADLGYTKA